MTAILKGFFTFIEAWLSMPHYLRLVVLGGPLLLALIHQGARRSRLVRAGFVLLLVGFVPLVLVGTFSTEDSPNPVGLGLLFVFLMPIASLLILGGTALALLRKQGA